MFRFQTGRFFTKGTEKENEPEQGSQILAVWGSPGSGKTTVSVKLAKCLAEKRQNVLLVLCDCITPMLPCICPPPNIEHEGSLRSVFAGIEITPNLIRYNCCTHKHFSHLSILGLQKGENAASCPEYTPEIAAKLILALREVAPYVVIDCGSALAYDILSTVTLMEADAVLRLATCDLKAVSYLSSQLSLLENNHWDTEKQYKAVSNVKPNQAGECAAQLTGGAVFTLPHSDELENQFLAGDLFGDLSLRDSRGFRKEIEKISKEVFGI